MTTTTQIELTKILQNKYLVIDEDGARLKLDDPSISNLNIDISLTVNPENFNCSVWIGESQVIFTNNELNNIYYYLLDAYNDREKADNDIYEDYGGYEHTVQLFI